jgi:hypothetical protein
MDQSERFLGKSQCLHHWWCRVFGTFVTAGLQAHGAREIFIPRIEEYDLTQATRHPAHAVRRPT